MTSVLRPAGVWVAGGLLLAALAFSTHGSASPPAPAAAASPAPAGTKPLVVLSGTDSKVRSAAFRRVDTDEQWAAAWKDHRGPDDWGHPRPAVDFTRCTVVAAFHGATHNTEGLSSDAVVETADKVVIRFNFQGYSTGFGVEPPEVSPFGFVVLPRTDKPIALEQDVSGGHKDVVAGGPAPAPRPVWKEVARLAPAGK